MIPALALVAAGCGDSNAPFAGVPNEGVLSSCSIEFFDGGPGAGGIPALVNPSLEAAPVVQYLPDEARVIGIERNGIARAYPFALMWWHEVANDTIGGEPVVITYCLLTGSGLGFDRQVEGQVHEFGVSGLILENNLTLFDRETTSLWHQLSLQALCGPAAGTELRRLPVIETTWGHWKSLYPNSTVLALNTGYPLQYGRYPYGDYDERDNDALLFPSRWFSPAPRRSAEPVVPPGRRAW